MSDDAREPEVLFHVDRGVGVVTLNRPAKINAVTEGMLDLIEEALDAWQDDDAVESLLLRGAGPRGFCAGGDITAIHRDATAAPARSVAMWRREYRGALRLARWGRPVVSYLDGIAMGAGVGLGGHVSLRVVTPRSRVGMPETLIVIAHRLSTVVDSDQIVVVDDGRVVGVGTHSELVESTPLYKDLAKHQLLV